MKYSNWAACTSRMLGGFAPGKPAAYFDDTILEYERQIERVHQTLQPGDLANAVDMLLFEQTQMPTASVFAKYLRVAIDNRERFEVRADQAALASPVTRIEQVPGFRRVVQSGVWDRATARGKVQTRYRNEELNRRIQANLDNLAEGTEFTSAVVKRASDAAKITLSDYNPPIPTEDEVDDALHVLARLANGLRGKLEDALAVRWRLEAVA